jgi:hypothetical protein
MVKYSRVQVALLMLKIERMGFQKLLAVCLLTVSSLSTFAQEFEGSVYFTRSNMMEVTKYAYHVKDNMVRIDEIVDGSDELVATLLVNLETEDMIALSHERNLYMERPHKSNELKAEGVVIKQGELKRSIHQMNCSQYRVRNKEQNRELMFWVTEGEYSFFPRLLKVLKRKDPFATYYMAMDNLENKLPLMAEEFTLLREKKGFMQVDKLERKELPNSMFEIPEGYEKVER